MNDQTFEKNNFYLHATTQKNYSRNQIVGVWLLQINFDSKGSKFVMTEKKIWFIRLIQMQKWSAGILVWSIILNLASPMRKTLGQAMIISNCVRLTQGPGEQQLADVFVKFTVEEIILKTSAFGSKRAKNVVAAIEYRSIVGVSALFVKNYSIKIT